MGNKLILKVPRATPRTGKTDIVKLDSEAMKILEEWHIATGFPLKQLASTMIKYASEYTEIEEL